MVKSERNGWLIFCYEWCNDDVIPQGSCKWSTCFHRSALVSDYTDTQDIWIHRGWINQNGNMGMGHRETNVESSHCVKQCVWNEWLHRIVSTDSSWNGIKTVKKFFIQRCQKFVSLQAFLGRLGKRVALSSQQRAGSLLERTCAAPPSSQRPADTQSSPSSCRDGSYMTHKTDQLTPKNKKMKSCMFRGTRIGQNITLTSMNDIDAGSWAKTYLILECDE